MGTITKRPVSPDVTFINVETPFGESGYSQTQNEPPNDSTWVRGPDDPGWAEYTCTIETPTLPDGAVWSACRLRIRFYGPDTYGFGFIRGTFQAHEYSWQSGIFNWTTYTFGQWPMTTLLTPVQAQIVHNCTGSGGGTGKFYFSEIYGDFIYVAKPVADVTGPDSPVTDTSFPVLTWDNSLDADGGVQSGFEARITSGSDKDANILASSGDVTSSSQSWQSTNSIPDGTSYYAHVRTRQTVNGAEHWSDWDSLAFTVSVDRPDPPTLTVTEDTDNARILIESQPDQGGDTTTESVQVQRSVNQGATWENIRGYLPDGEINRGLYADEDGNLCNNPGFVDGIDPWNNGGMSLFTPEFIPVGYGPTDGYNTCAFINARTEAAYVEYEVPVISGRHYSFSGWCARQQLSTDTTARLEIFNENGVQKATSTDFGIIGATWTEREISSVTADSTGTWKFRFVVHKVGSAPLLDAYITGFVITDLDAGSDPVPWSIYDCESGNGVSTLYRARGHHDSGGLISASDWTYATSPVSWESDRYWIKHPSNPSLNFSVLVRSAPEVASPSRGGIFQPLGSDAVVSVQDKRGPKTGTITLLTEADERAQLDALLEQPTPLLIQGPIDGTWPDRWVSISDRTSARAIDNVYVGSSNEALAWTEVDYPEGFQE